MESVEDKLIWGLTNIGAFSTASTYQMMCGNGTIQSQSGSLCGVGRGLKGYDFFFVGPYRNPYLSMYNW